MVTQNKKVSLPRYDNNKRVGFGSLVFLFTNNTIESIEMINNRENCTHDGKYPFYYYNRRYIGKINGRRYNIKDLAVQKNLYARILKDCGPVHPHPLTPLYKSANRNCYYDMSKYYEIYLFMTKKFSAVKKVLTFWDFFKSIWISTETSTFPAKTILINVDNFDNFKVGTLKEKLDNPLFMLYYTMYKKFDLLTDLNIDFVLYCKKSVLKINPSMCDEKSYLVLYRELQKLFRKQTAGDALNPKKIDEEEQKNRVEESLKEKYNFTGSDIDDDVEVTDLNPEKKEEKPIEKDAKELEAVVNDKINQKITDNSKVIKSVVPDAGSTKEAANFVKVQSEMDLDNDKELTDKLYQFMKKEKVPTTPLSTARDAALRKRQESLKMDNLSFSDLDKMKAAKRAIPKKNISSSVKTINENVKNVKFANMNKDYIENIMPSDIAKVFTSLNNKDMKLFVRDIKVEDTSDELNYKETWRVVLEDEQKQRHNITVDIPKFIENKFMYLGSNKKIIDKQNFLYPVVKTAPDTVQIVTNYNKVFIRRVGTKSISSVERVMKLISSSDECYKYFTIGNNSATNKSFVTSIEYDEFAKALTKFNSPNCLIMFNQGEAIKYAEDHNIHPFGDDPKYIFIGLLNKKYLFIDADDQSVKTIDPNDIDSATSNDDIHTFLSKRYTICDIIVSELPDELQKTFWKTRSTKKLMYSTATVMAQAIPFIVLLMFWEGFSSVIKKMGMKYSFSKSYPTLVKANQSVVRFKDCYFLYDEDLPTSLLMNGIKLLDTENHDIKEYDTNEPYIDFFVKKYGRASAMNAIYNYYEFLIDPITEEILSDINLPTDLISLCIYANSLLADESYTRENSQTLSRVRSTEIIPAILYTSLSNEYLNYKNSAGKKKISLPKDCVIKQLLALQTVEDYSTLNPVVELEKDRAITSKGFRGINLDRAYTEEKRSYDDSMIGVISMDTSPDGNCGINRFLTLEPNITSARGYVDIKTKKELGELKDVNLFSPAELLYPLGNTRDDSIRIAMACKQSKHVIPVKNASPTLISNGTDEAVRFYLSSDFVVNAEEDGEVIDFDQKDQILMIKYKSGKNRAINLAPQIVKNGGGGFFLNNTLKTNLKVGDKFKKDEALAWHKDFFKNDGVNGLRMNVGVLEKVAIASSYDTYNDSTVITHKLAKDSEADMTFCKQVVIGKNSNVYDIRKVGDSVSIGDPLMSFDTSFDDSDLNKMLSNLSDDNKEVLEENSSNIIKSKYAGRIIDIKIYSTVDVEELSPSLQKIVKAYYNRIDSKKKFVSKYDSSNNKSIVKCGLLLNESTGKVEPNVYGVVRGQKVQDSVLIEFYIEHGDIMGVGDKLAYFTALKSIVGEVIPEGYEPYSEFRPEEEVSSLIGPSAILKRQVPSIILTVLGNKVIVELKRKLKEIYES